ncbi:MAG: hypothetical protein IJ388_04350 [Oscillospiraceae bacterium]|nr:hypothetical protein [Oscillospiraceae bacterium]
MKDISLIVWLTQFSMSVVAPLVCAPLLAVWLRSQFGWGQWVIWVGVAIGAICAFDGLRTSLKLMSRLSKRKKDPDPPPVSFNDHD